MYDNRIEMADRLLSRSLAGFRGGLGHGGALEMESAAAGVAVSVNDGALDSMVSGRLYVGEASLALDSLTAEPAMHELQGGVKLCYLDPPYNTGEEYSHYQDRKPSEEWLADFRAQLLRLKRLLAPDGSVWVHLDDSEQHRARVVMDEVFGDGAFVATVIWQKRVTRESRTAFSSMHEYIHVYSPMGRVGWKNVRNGVADMGEFSNPDGDPRGPWRSSPMSVQAGHATASQFYTLVTPTGAKHNPPVGRCWAYSQKRIADLDREGRIYWPRDGEGKPRLKKYMSEGGGLAPFTIWFADDVGDTSRAKKELLQEFPNQAAFDTPKPIDLLRRIIEISSDPGDLVLDYYLGSGTTAVAAASLGRRWIGVERNPQTVESFVVPRLKRVYGSLADKAISVTRC